MNRRTIIFFPFLFAFLLANNAVFSQSYNDEYTVGGYILKTEDKKTEPDSLAFQGDEEIAIFDRHLSDLQSSYVSAVRERKKFNCADGINPTYSKEEYKARLSQLPNLIEMPYNSIVQSYIDLYTGRRREQVARMLGLSNHYFPLFEEALEANGMPLELRYLPVIESALNPVALSKAGASGLWQFMIGTGRAYGLTVNNLVDERRDPYKATHAGVKYLKDLYNIYNDWHLAIAAYNCGPGNVNKAIRRAGGKRDYWEIYPFLPRETRGYVPAFIAANYVMNYYAQHNICPAEIAEIPTATDTIMVNERMHLQQVSSILNIPMEELRYINPQYRRDLIPGNINAHVLALPQDKIGVFLDNKDVILAYKADELVNNLRAEVTPSQTYASSSGGSAAPVSGNKIYYKVKSGDTLGGIAAKHKVSVASIKKWNKLNSNLIRVGQQLVIYR